MKFKQSLLTVVAAGMILSSNNIYGNLNEDRIELIFLIYQKNVTEMLSLIGNIRINNNDLYAMECFYKVSVPSGVNAIDYIRNLHNEEKIKKAVLSQLREIFSSLSENNKEILRMQLRHRASYWPDLINIAKGNPPYKINMPTY